RDEVHVGCSPARLFQRPSRRRLGELERAFPRAGAQLVDRLVRPERCRIDPQIAAVDVTSAKEPAPLLVAVPRKRQDLRLGIAMGRRRGGDGRDLRERYPSLLPRRVGVRWGSEDTAGVKRMPLFSFEGKSPKIHPTAFIAPTAVIIGDVTIEERASVWYNAVLRGDFNPIVVHRGANVQDCAVVHVTPRGGTEIGAGSTVGHNCAET